MQRKCLHRTLVQKIKHFDSYLFVNDNEVTKFKAKDSEIKANQLTLGSISTSPNLSNSDIEDSKLYGIV